LIILAILSETERYGFEIDKIIKNRHINLWNQVALSSIYAVLRRLADRGLVTAREVSQSSRPPRKLYAMSAAGRIELENSLEEALISTDRLLGRFEVILIVWPILTDDKKRRLLLSYQRKLKEKLISLADQIEREINPISAAQLERPRASIRAELEWLNAFSVKFGFETIEFDGG